MAIKTLVHRVLTHRKNLDDRNRDAMSFKDVDDVINEIAVEMITRLRQEGYGAWLCDNFSGSCSRYVKAIAFGEDGSVREHTTRISDHPPKKRNFNFYIDVYGYLNADLRLVLYPHSSRRLSGGVTECIGSSKSSSQEVMIELSAQDRSEFCVECRVDCWKAKTDRAVATVTEELGSRKITMLPPDQLERAYPPGLRVKGKIVTPFKGGFMVDLGDTTAFLPGSLVELRSVRHAGSQIGRTLLFEVVRIDHRHGNVVVSLCAILEGKS